MRRTYLLEYNYKDRLIVQYWGTAISITAGRTSIDEQCSDW